MAIIRVHSEKNFTTVNNSILRNKEASLKAKGLLVWMLSCNEDWDFSVAGMVSCLKEKEDAIANTLKELENLGYLQREKLMPERDAETGEVIRSRVEWVYNIYEVPQEILYTGFQSVEIQCTENPVQRNNNIKELKNKEKAPEPVLSTKNRKRDLIRRSTNTLVDDLESGKDIDIQKKAKKKSPKELFREECLEIIEHEYSDYTAELLTDYFNFISDPKQADSDNKMKVVKTVSAWKKKLDRLEELVKEGYDCEKLIKQSLENKKYVFYPLESTDRNSQNYNQQKELCNVIPSSVNRKEWMEEQMKLGKKVY